MVSWTFVELDDVGSTQAVAKGLAAMGSPEGTTVVAKSQSSGSGRMQRRWDSPKGGLYMSFIIRPKNLVRPEAITLVAAASVVEGVRRTTGLVTKIRWPNDVMMGSKKLGGILAEAQSYKEEITQVVVGIGLNCNTPFSNNDALKDEATSLFDEIGHQVEISEMKHSVLDSFSSMYDSWQVGSEVVSRWRSHLSTIGKPISVKLKTEETPFSCLAVDVDADGALVVEVAESSRTIHAEDLEWLREEP